jgi:hypothetical protein
VTGMGMGRGFMHAASFLKMPLSFLLGNFAETA